MEAALGEIPWDSVGEKTPGAMNIPLPPIIEIGKSPMTVGSKNDQVGTY